MSQAARSRREDEYKDKDKNDNVNESDVSDSCPFCMIATNFPPIDVHDLSNEGWDPDRLSPPSYVLFSTKHVVCFLDIAPLTRGHVLVAPRKHRTKMGDLRGDEMAEIGRVLPCIARAVTRTVLPDIPHDEVDYNIIQNNGPGAAQVVPHLHFHVVPRPPLNYQPPPLQPKTETFTTTTTAAAADTDKQQSQSQSQSQSKSKYGPSTLPTGIQQSYVQFGRGVRHELDDDEATATIQQMRRHLLTEWTKEFGSSGDNESSSPSSSSLSTPPLLPPKTSYKTLPPRPEKPDSTTGFTGTADDAAYIEGGPGLVSNVQRRAQRRAGTERTSRRTDEKL